jgi:hypothetical protein
MTVTPEAMPARPSPSSPPPSALERVPNTPPGDDASPPSSLIAGQCGPGEEGEGEGDGDGEGEDEDEDEEEEEEGEEEEEAGKQGMDEAFLLPPSTAPAMMQLSRTGRKRAPTLKALEPKRRLNRVEAVANRLRFGCESYG